MTGILTFCSFCWPLEIVTSVGTRVVLILTKGHHHESCSFPFFHLVFLLQGLTLLLSAPPCQLMQAFLFFFHFFFSESLVEAAMVVAWQVLCRGKTATFEKSLHDWQWITKLRFSVSEYSFIETASLVHIVQEHQGFTSINMHWHMKGQFIQVSFHLSQNHISSWDL